MNVAPTPYLRRRHSVTPHHVFTVEGQIAMQHGIGITRWED
ncbi:hypothetical protein [Paenibacillus sp. MER TA 81-3]|nr:hypothetical protein [Paenibacillus sp. MER TA 81-3]